MKTVVFFGLSFMCCDIHEAAEYILKEPRNNGVPSIVVTPNVNLIVMMCRNKAVFDVFNSAFMVVADGMPLVWLSKLLRLGIKERVCGSDLMPQVSRLAALTNKSVAIVGGLPGIANAAANKLLVMYPQLTVCGTYSPPFGFESDEDLSAEIVNLCNDWRPDFLFLCLGSPKQEIWANKYRDNLLGVGTILCVGAAADFMAGSVKRAPKLIRDVGFEWLWRVFQEPKRLGMRYLTDAPIFVFYAIKELFVQLRK